MAKKKKTLTEEEKFQQELQAEAELTRLQRQYNILEKEQLGVSRTIMRQQKVLDIFKNEQNNLLTDLAVATAEAKCRDDEMFLYEISNLLDEYDKHSTDLKNKKTEYQEMCKHLIKLKKDVHELSKKLISDEQYESRILNGRKVVDGLENRLDVQIKQFCTICSDNQKLRQEIDSLLIERYEFNKIWESLLNSLYKGKKFMLDLIEQATTAFDRREEWVSKLQYLRNKAYSDLINHIQDMREMQRKIDNNFKLKEFLKIKGQKRILVDLIKAEEAKRQKEKDAIETNLTNYQEILNSIKEFSGEERITEIVKNFVVQEMENFSLFNFINDLNKQMEGLNESINSLTFEIDEQKVLSEIRSDQQRVTLENLQEEHEKCTQETKSVENELNDIEKKISTILNGISKLFGQFNCQKDPLYQLLGENEAVNYYNAMLYLQILEQRIEAYMVSCYHKEKELFDKKKIKLNAMVIQPIKLTPTIFTIKEIVKTTPCPLCVEHECVSDVTDVVQIPMNKNEIQGALRERLRLEDGLERLHNVSACHLPKAREIIQKRYQ